MGFTTAELTYTEQVYVTVLWCALFALHAVTLCWYVARRHVDVIAQRNVSAFVVFWLVTWTSVVTYQTRRSWLQFAECDGAYYWWILTAGGFTGLFSCTAYRCLDLIARFEQQRAALALQLQSEGVTQVRGTDWASRFDDWFLRNQTWLTSQPMKVALLVPPAVTLVVRAFVKPPINPDTCLPVDWLVEGVAVLMCGVVMVLAMKMRNVKENLGIKREFMLLGLCGMAYCGPYVVWVNAFSDRGVPPIWHLWTIFCITWMWYCSLYEPVALSYRRHAPAVVAKPAPVPAAAAAASAAALAKSHALNPNPQRSGQYEPEPSVSAPSAASTSAQSKSSRRTRQRTKAVPAEVATLDRVMAQSLARRAFIQFLCLEFSVENVLFLVEVDRFREYALARAAHFEHTAVPTSAAVPALAADATPTLGPVNGAWGSAAPALGGAALRPRLSELEQDLEAARADVRARALDIFGRFVAAGTRHEVNLSAANTQPLRMEFADDYAAALRLRKIGKRKSSGTVGRVRTGLGISPAVSSDGNGHVAHVPGALPSPEHVVSPQQPQPPLGFRFGTTAAARADAAATNAAAAAAASELADRNTPTLTATASTASFGERKHAHTAHAAAPSASGMAFTRTAFGGSPDRTAPVPLPAPVPGLGARKESRRAAVASRPVRTIAYYAVIFDAARGEIHRLLSNDSFPRFVSSPAFDMLLTSLQSPQGTAAPIKLQTIDSPSHGVDGGGGGGVAAPMLTAGRSPAGIAPNSAAVAAVASPTHAAAAASPPAAQPRTAALTVSVQKV